MRSNSISRQRSYYEEYWRFRINKGRLHTLPGNWVPKRLSVAVRMIEKELRRATSPQPMILDLGCGEGTLGKLLETRSDRSYLLHGCDISATALELARPYYSEVFDCDVETEALPAGSDTRLYDIIVALDVLEHLLKPIDVLSNVFKALSEKGKLVVSFPNIAWYRYRIELLRGRFPEDYLFGSGDHIQQFTLPSFTRLLRMSGFKPVEMDGRFSFPFFFRPGRLFAPVLKKFPNLFGYQLVIKARKAKSVAVS